MLLAPEICICCGAKCYGLPLCKNCSKLFVSQVFHPSVRHCSVCGRVLLSEQTICMECREKTVIENLDSCISCHPYLMWKKQLLFQWKISGNRNYTPLISLLLHNGLQCYYPNAVIVPVPPRPGKLRKKGWDQIQDICTYLKWQYGYEICPVLKRLEKKQQKKLSREQRIAHLGSDYCIIEKKQKLIQGKEVVLLDDIMTTGVTLENCGRLLKNTQAKSVHGLTIFSA